MKACGNGWQQFLFKKCQFPKIFLAVLDLEDYILASIANLSKTIEQPTILETICSWMITIASDASGSFLVNQLFRCWIAENYLTPLFLVNLAINMSLDLQICFLLNMLFSVEL